MAVPAEVVAAPLTVWLAPVGFAFPDVGAVPIVTNGWVKLGTSGAKNYTEAGVTVTHNQTVSTFTPAGGTAPRKAWRNQEELLIAFELVDLTAAQYAKVLNGVTVTQTGAGGGKAGSDSFDILRGVDVTTFALLARGVSPANPAYTLQYQVPMVYEAASPAPVFMKGTPAGLACQFAALEDPTLGFGKVVVQTAAVV